MRVGNTIQHQKQWRLLTAGEQLKQIALIVRLALGALGGYPLVAAVDQLVQLLGSGPLHSDLLLLGQTLYLLQPRIAAVALQAKLQHPLRRRFQ